MFYIVGLGNPGDKYLNTRHNVGWQALDLALQAWGLPSVIEESGMSGRTTEGNIDEQFARVLYPDTFMNNSGAAVQKFVPKDDIKNLIVIHDDIDLPFGEVKVGKGRGAGGNNGVGDIIKKLGSKDFVRVRIGIAPKSFWTGKVKRPQGGGPLEHFVLKPFTPKEREQLPDIFSKAQKAIELIVSEGVEKAMNEVN